MVMSVVPWFAAGCFPPSWKVELQNSGSRDAD
jgi:hypothetical protein